MVWDWNVVGFVEISFSPQDELNVVELSGRVANALDLQNLGVVDWTWEHPGGGLY